jgi:hypothetical protein
MQPNPGDTTNALMVQLIKAIADGSGAVDISNLSSSTGYSSSTVWMQALAYASLAFSLLAAFGAVVGKQWLNSYKAAWGRGSLEDLCLQRQKRVDGLQHLFTAIWAFLSLLQISLLLFGLSVSANLWTQQTTISSIIICSTCLGILFRVTNIFVSVLHPDTSFGTPVSKLIGTTLRKLLPVRSTFTPASFVRSSAVRWILESLEAQRHPEISETAAAMVPRVLWPSALDVSAAYSHLLDNFKARRDKPELYMTYGKAMAHLCIQSVKIDEALIRGERGRWDSLEGRSRFICDAFKAGRLAWKQLLDVEAKSAQLDFMEALYAKLRHRADVRTALRTMVVHGRGEHLSRPDDEELIWYGNLRWWHNEGLAPSCAEFDWLVDYVKFQADDETKGDALLVLSAIPDLGSSAKQESYVTTLIHCMGHEHPRVRYAALRVLDAHVELAWLANNFAVPLSDELSRALLTAVDPNNGWTIRASGSNPSFHHDRDRCYLRLIFALAKDEGWCVRLVHDRHVMRCISLVDDVLENMWYSHNFYLAGIFLRIVSSGGDSPSTTLGMDRWRMLVKQAWSGLSSVVEDMHRCLEVLPALVKATKENFQGLNHGEQKPEQPGQNKEEPNWELPAQNNGEPTPGLPNRRDGEQELVDSIVDVELVLEKLTEGRETPGQEDALDGALEVVQDLLKYFGRLDEVPRTFITDCDAITIT